MFLVVGIASIALTLYAWLTPEAGWEKIEANSTEGETCAGEFSLMYHIGVSGVSASGEKKAVTAVYTDAAQTAHMLFSAETEAEGIQNIAYLNAHPNETVSVEPALYEAFELLEKSGMRLQYMGPAYEIYNGVFSCAEDYLTADFDPLQNESLKALFSEIAAFAGDPEAIELELLGDNRVCLKVSEAYLKFAEENETGRFMDLYWMKNAFIADFIAEKLIEGGYKQGVLSSYDGFVRNMEESGNTDFRFILFDRTPNAVYPAATMRYTGPSSLVYLRSYPAAASDMRHYYTFDNGEIRVPYLDIEDALPVTAVGGLASYAENMSCAELLLRIAPNFVAEEFSEEEILALTKDGIESVFCQDGVLSHTSRTVEFSDIHPDETVVCITE